jgi:branched-chain amino acid transport system ATP-binding protein
VLKVKELHAGYGHLQVVWGVSLSIEKGEIIAVLGLNGAGKTTTLKSIAGLIKPMGGTVEFNGANVTGISAAKIVRHGIVFVPEERNLFSGMTVAENLRMGAYIVHDRNLIKETREYIFSLFPRLAERRKQYTGTMSGGERQMVAIARGLMSSPKLVILDEPSMGLSPQNVDIVFEAIEKLKSEGVTVVIVEQNVESTLSIADRGYVLDHGRIVMFGTSKELLANDEIKRMYLGIE